MARVFTLADTFRLTAAVAAILILGRLGLHEDSWLFGWGMLLAVLLGSGLLLHVGDRLSDNQPSRLRLLVLLAILVGLMLAATYTPRFL